MLRYHQIKAGKYTLDLQEKTFVMGIVNVTPDSFSDGGKYMDLKAAITHSKKLVADGADILDIGGESTRPGHIAIDAEEEAERVVPIIQAIKKEVDVPISIDTYKAEVARQAVEAGADIINDIWGAKREPAIAEVAAKYNVPIILMHNRENMNYTDLMSDMIADLYESIQIAKKAGVQDEQIILDPGIGFAKDMEQNLEVLRNLEHLNVLGYPILLGTSRKRVIGYVLDLPPEERVEGTGATTCLGIQKGANIIRVHDVLENTRMAKMMDAMLGRRGR